MTVQKTHSKFLLTKIEELLQSLENDKIEISKINFFLEINQNVENLPNLTYSMKF